MHVNGVDDLILYVASSPDEVCTDRIASCHLFIISINLSFYLVNLLIEKKDFDILFSCFLHCFMH